MADRHVSAAPAPRNIRERDLEFWQLHAIWKLAELDGGPADRELAFRDMMLATASSYGAVALKVAACALSRPARLARNCGPA